MLHFYYFMLQANNKYTDEFFNLLFTIYKIKMNTN